MVESRNDGRVKMMVETLGIHRTLAVCPLGAAPQRHPGAGHCLYYWPQRPDGVARRGGGCDRHLLRLPGPCVRCRDWPVGTADGVVGRLYGAEMGRRGLPVVYRPPDAAVASAVRLPRRRLLPTHVAFPRVLAGGPDQRAQSEGGAVFPGVPAAIRGRGLSAQDAGFPGAGPDLHFHRHAVVSRHRRLRGAGRPAASGNRPVRWPGSTACSAGCSSISGFASRCWRGAEASLQP